MSSGDDADYAAAIHLQKIDSHPVMLGNVVRISPNLAGLRLG